jgi:SNF2 family DNA or RNA helicase
VLVICPAVAKGVWKREAAKWRPDFKVSILSGRGSFRWPTKGEIVVINADILSDDFEAPLADTVVVADEAHMFKGGNKTARGRRFAAMAEAARKADGKVWMLTATPLLNRAPELWNLYMAGGIANEAFGSFTKFKALFNAFDNGYGLEWGQPDPETVAPLIRKVSLRRLRTEVLPELPVKTWRTYDVDLDGKAKKALDKMLAALNKKGMTLPEVKEGDKVSIDQALEQIKKLDGTSFSEFSEARAMLAKAKIPVMLEVVDEYEEQDEPLVVFSAHRAPIDLLATRPGWRVITGDTSAEERTEIEEQFQAGKLKGVGATIKAGGVAITLTKSAAALFVDRELTPALNAQAEDRVCRIGQTRGVVITTLVAAHPLDAHITGLLDWKRALVEKSVDAARVKQGEAVSIVTTAPVVDFAALAGEVQAEIDAAEERKNKAQEAARERQKALPADTTAEKEEAKARRERRRQRILEAAKKDNTVRRPAKDAREEWAHEALVTLADLDPDRARTKNDVGFNASDGGTGHVLAVLTEVGLTEAEWSNAIDLCKKYHRQVGRCPAA